MCLALYGQIIGVDLLDEGLYFGFEGPTLRFPTQMNDITVLKQALEALYFFKVRDWIFGVYCWWIFINHLKYRKTLFTRLKLYHVLTRIQTHSVIFFTLKEFRNLVIIKRISLNQLTSLHKKTKKMKLNCYHPMNRIATFIYCNCKCII